MKKRRNMWIYVLFAVLGSCVGTLLFNVLLNRMQGVSEMDVISDFIASGIGAALGCIVFIKKLKKDDESNS